MQDHPTNELHIEVAHSQNTPAGFAYYSKCFRKDLVEMGR